MRSLLIISFSPLDRDARVLRQIQLLSADHRVTTLGFGPAPDGAAEHLSVAVPPGSGWRRDLRFYAEAALLRLRWYRLMAWSDPLARAARRALRSRRFTRIIANDIEAVPVALSVASGDRVHADLHEYSPGLHDDNPRWKRLRTPYYEWLVRTYATRAASATTVGDGLAQAYRKLGLNAAIVMNAPHRRDCSPGAVGSPLRLVHAGAAIATRRIEVMIEAVSRASNDVHLTLHLTPNDPAYLRRLARLAETSGGRVTLLPPVPHHELLATLNGFDIGIHVLPPTVTNQAIALPNKFFDFVQARIGMIIGPTPGMASLLERHGLGIVADGFDEPQVRAAVEALTPDSVRAFKAAADIAATELSAASQLPVWQTAVEALPAN